MLITVGKYFNLSNKVAQKVCLEGSISARRAAGEGKREGRPASVLVTASTYRLRVQGAGSVGNRKSMSETLLASTDG